MGGGEPGLRCGVGGAEGPRMPKFKVMMADDQGRTLYDEWIEAAGPREACAIAIADAGTADVAETEEQSDPAMLLRSVPKTAG